MAFPIHRRIVCLSTSADQITITAGADDPDHCASVYDRPSHYAIPNVDAFRPSMITCWLYKLPRSMQMI